MPNLSQIKRQRMMDFLARIKEEHKDDDAMLIALGEIESELNAKKYGLVWEEHEEAVDVKMRTHIPVFKEDTDKEITAAAGEVYNFLLEGDNLHSLRLLEKTHTGRINIIYIDPPYNTLKSGFTYNDTMVEPTDGYRHSKWLSFMQERLQIAKNLLSEKGVIFISIDNSELYNLKLLCDAIFGEENFVGNIVWRTTTDNNVTQITTEHEYIICYALNKNNLDKWTSKSPIVDIIQEKYEELRASYGSDNESIQSSLRIWIKQNQNQLKGFTHYDNVDDKGVFHDGDIANTVQGGYKYDVIHPVTGKACKIPEKGFRFSQETMETMLENDDVMFGADETTLIKPKIRLLDNKATLRAYYYEDNRSATKSLESIFNEKSRFSNPKSTNLLKLLFSYAGGKDAIILDFFAGSGSTGEAVIQLNNEDGGSRQFILCTNNEVSAINTVRYLHDKGYLLDYNPGERTNQGTILGKIKKTFEDNPEQYKVLFASTEGVQEYEGYGICRFVTYPRLKTVITGKRSDGSPYSDGIPANLKYYRTDYVSKDEEYLSDALMEHISEMIQLEHGVKLDGQRYIMVLDDDEADELAAHWDEYPDVKALYVSKNVLFTTKQNTLFKNVEVHIIPDYYFNFELREVGETW
jgi:adenine-specific DNA-methyltransferase